MKELAGTARRRLVRRRPRRAVRPRPGRRRRGHPGRRRGRGRQPGPTGDAPFDAAPRRARAYDRRRRPWLGTRRSALALAQARGCRPAGASGSASCGARRGDDPRRPVGGRDRRTRRHRCVRHGVARPAARRRRRPGRALTQGSADRSRARPRPRRRATARGPARRCGQSRRRPLAGCRRARGSAPDRPVGGLSCALGPAHRGRAGARQRRHPDCARSPTASSTRSSSRGPAWPGSAGSTPSPRCSSPTGCCRRRGRARSRSSAAPTTPGSSGCSASSTTQPPAPQ